MLHLKVIFIILFLIPLCLASQKQETPTDKSTPYELMSSYYAKDFRPFKKHSFYTGLALSLSDRSLNNVDQLVQNVIDGNDLSYQIIFKGGFYTGDYAMVGLDFEYKEEKFEGTVFRQPDTLLSNSISRLYSITPNVRSTVPLTANERLSFFTILGVSVGLGNSLTRNTKNLDEIEKVYTDDFKLRVGISPGVTFFAIENFALEVQLDVLGYELKVRKSEINGVEQSKDVRNNVDFNIDVLSIKLGLAYYFKPIKKSKKIKR
jgi:hypothetical protein